MAFTARNLDFKKGFLNGHLERQAFAELPKENVPELKNEGYVMKLKRRLYGLRDAANIWNQLLLEVLNQVLFVEMGTAFCLFVSDGIIFIC